MENIQVAIRVRPLNKKELSRSDDNIWEIPNTDTIALSSSNSREYFASKKINCTGRTSFYFDHCFSTERDNIQVYQQVAKRIVLSSLNGINGTIFMYGQTGSGKTYTMMGLNKNQEEEHDTSVHSRGTSPFNRSSTPPRKQPSKKNLPIAGEIYEIEEKPSHGNYIITDITENTGILVLALRDIFDTIEKDMDKTFFLRCSYVEIYNDQIYDLLKSAERMSEVLSVNEDPNKDFYIKGLTEESVSSIEEILDKLKKGEANRHIARTTMNHSSSRSHTIFRLTVQSVTNNYIREYRRENCKNSTNINNIELKSKFGETGDQNSKTEGTTVTESLLNFVDLAGSEKVSNHQMLLNDPEFMNVDQGGIYGRDSMMAASKLKERVKEGQHINKSLFFLTQVISLKSEGKSNQHIPYRNSPLTKILRSSLGGNSRTLIILCLTPVASQFEQTMSTLRFGMNAKKIENKVQANIITRDDDVGLKMLIADYEKKLKDSESARQEEQAKSAALLRQIEELQLHKSALIERLGSLCKSRITKMAESVTEEDLSSFYKQVQQRNTYFDKVGVVFSSKDLKKYDHLLESSTHHDVSIKRNAQKGRRSSQVQEDDLDLDDERTVPLVKKNAMGHQNKIEESLSKFYAKLYKAHKEQNTILIKKLNVLQKNMQVLCERNLENYNNYIKFSAKSQTRSDQLKEVVAEFQLEIERSNQLQASLDLYKNLKGMTDLNDNDISDLEKHFWERLDQIKMERAKRMVIKEMSSMKDSSDCTKESIDSPKESSGSERRINFQAFLSLDEPSELGDNNEEASKQGQEELNIKEIISQGLEDIDRELEKNKRILLETKEILCPEEAEESKRVGRSLRTERGERNGRETSAASSPTKTPARNSYANISGGKGASSSKKKSPRIQAEALPKLDLGAYLSNITVEPNLPKLSINPMSTKRLGKPEIMSPQISQFEVSSGREQQEELGEMKKEPDHESNKVEDGNMETKETNPRPEKSLNSSLLGPQDGPALFIRHSNIPKPRNLSQAGKGEENKEKGNSQLAPKDNSSITSSKIPSPTRPEKPQVQANNELAVLQNKLTKHLTSLEKYLAKPSSASRRSRSMRTEIISFTQTNQTANSNNESVLTPSRPRLLKEETGVLSRNKEGEFEYQEDSEGEHKMKENKKTSTSEKNSKPYSDLKSRRYTKEMNDSDFLEIGNGEEMRHGEMLNLTNIEKEETIFSTSIFSIKDFDGLNKEKDHDNFPENNVLKQLDNILGKGEHEFEFDACLNQQMNDSRKRRKRAERLQRMENDS